MTWITLELTELSEGTMDWLPTGTSAISMVDPECLNNLNNGIKYLSNTNVCENTPFNQPLIGIFIPRYSCDSGSRLLERWSQKIGSETSNDSCTRRQRQTAMATNKGGLVWPDLDLFPLAANITQPLQNCENG